MRTVSLRSLSPALAAASILVLALSATASAEVVERHVYGGPYPTKSFDGSDAVGAGTFGEPQNIAINQATGDVYVGGSSGFVYRLNEAGVSQPFSAVAPNTVLNQPTYGLGSLKVDNSGTATQGRIYAKTESPILEAFLPSGAAITSGFPIENLGDGCGMDIAPDGGIWVTNYGDGTHRYGSDGSNSNEMIAFGGMCGFAIDSEENFYIPGYGGSTIRKYSRSGALLDEDWGGENQGSENLAIDRSDDTVYAARGNSVNVFDSTGKLIDTFGLPEATKSYPGLGNAEGIAVNETTGDVYVGNGATGKVDRFVRTGPITIPNVTTETPSVTPTTATLKAHLDPDAANSGGPITNCLFEWGSSTEYDHIAPCDQATPIASPQNVTATITGLTTAAVLHFRIVASNANEVGAKGADRTFQPSGPPIISNDTTSEVFSDGARMNADIDAAGATTSFSFEWGTAPCSSNPCTSVTTPEGALKKPLGVQNVSYVLTGLAPGSTYFWRVVAVNNNSTVDGADQEFTTFPLEPPTVDSCGNALVRKQTGASLVPDCRAYELVSAVDTGGYDVESSLVPGQHPLAGYAEATNPTRVLYTVHFGAIPGIGDPPNFGDDPYVATRGEDGWTTQYVGVPVSSAPDPSAFGSPLTGADGGLDTMAFGGPSICDPCLSDGTTGIPIRLPSGQLVQGMKGSIDVLDPTAAGEVRKQFSADGNHFVFGSKEKFEPAGNSGSVSIYDRDLTGGGTQVVSTMPDGSTMSGEVGELDISADGSRDPDRQEGRNRRRRQRPLRPLHAHRRQPRLGGLGRYAGRGDLRRHDPRRDERVLHYPDPLAGDGDSGTDVYRAGVGSSSATITRVSTGIGGTGDTNACTPADGWNSIEGHTDCGALGIAGGGGVATGDGTVYFLSPELLAGPSNGVAGEPNLFSAAVGGTPQFVATLGVDDPLVVHAAGDAALRSTEDFQVTPSGDFAAFGSRRSVTGYPNNDHLAVYRYDRSNGTVVCASCAPTGARTESDGVLPNDGGGLSNDGRVFFTTGDPLNLRDLNGGKTDAYEWTSGGPRLISTGTSRFDSAVLSAGLDGRDVTFFTHDLLTSQDHNGNLVKIYDAREEGGFYVQLNEPPCRASDECHGPGTQAPPPPDIGTYRGDGGQAEAAPAGKPKVRCRGNRVKRHGVCVRPRGHKRHERSHRHG